MTGIDIVRRRTHLHGTLIILCLIPAGLITTVPGVLRSSLFPFPHDLIISLLYLFEHLFRLLFIGIIDIRIRMIFSA